MAAAADSANGSSTHTKFPVVFIHGVFGYGRQRPLWNLGSPPYWPEQHLREINANHVIVDVGVASSDHDRACEVFYQLFGGRVDYGEQHSREANHNRYGLTFTAPLHPQWSASQPVHLVGHSFGATTAIELYQLICEDFFNVGSDHLWIRSIVSIAGPLTGTTLSHMMGLPGAHGPMQPFSIAHCMSIGVALWFKLTTKIPLLKDAYDLRMDQWTDHSLRELASVSGPVNSSKDTALFGALPAVRITRNSTLRHMEKLYLMSITTSPRSLKNLPATEFALFCLTVATGLGKFPFPRMKWWPGKGARAAVVALLGCVLWRRVQKLDLAKMPSFAGLMWLMRRRVNSLPQIFDGFKADHWEHNDGAVNIHSMLRPWFPKPEEVRNALSSDAQAASIPASTSSTSLSLAGESDQVLARCESHISITGFHRETEVNDETHTTNSSQLPSVAPMLRSFEKGRWYVYRVDSNHLAGTHWQNEARDLYRSLFTLMKHEYEKEQADEGMKHRSTHHASDRHQRHFSLAQQDGLSRSQSSRQLPRVASFG
ncbi:Lipase 2 [Globisporangium polare]